jgi:iron transport multicopper oxidase
MNVSAFFNNISYTAPKVPTLYSVMSTGADAINSVVYGEFSHAFVLDHLQTINIVVNNHGERCTCPRFMT